jgi:hypothetical protein
MALTQEDIATIGTVISRQIDEREATMRAEINQAFANTGQAFETRIQQVIETERETFFEALRQIMEQMGEIRGFVAALVPPEPEPFMAGTEGMTDDLPEDDALVDEDPQPPTKGVVESPFHPDVQVATGPGMVPPPAQTPIGGATFGVPQ